MPVRPRNRAYMLGPNTSSWPSQVGSLDPYIILLFSSLIIIVFTLIPPEVRSMDIPYMSPFNTSPLYLRRSVFLKRPFSQCTEDQQAIPLPVTSGPRISSINFPTRQATKRQRGKKKKKKAKESRTCKWIMHNVREAIVASLGFVRSQHRHDPFGSYGFIELMIRLE